MNTTLNEISNYHPCKSGWKTLLKSLGKTSSDDEPISFKHILESNGIEDAVWCLRTLEYKEICLFCADVAESVLPFFEKKYPEDKRPRKAIEGIRLYQSGDITTDYLNLLRDADAAYAYAYADAAAAAAAAAYAAADAAADAAYDAAAYAANAYAANAAAAAAYAAADADAYTAADAAAYAADAAAYAADAAAYAANAAAYATDTAAREKQWKLIEDLFIKYFCND